MVLLLFNLLYAIYAVNNKGVLAVDIKDYVYTEPGGNVTLNCSNNEGVMEWTFESRHRNDHLTISINKQIRPNPPEIRYHYEVTDGETYNLQIVNATSFTEGQYRCFANITKDRIHYFYLLLKAPPLEIRVMNLTEKNTIIGKENENLTLTCYSLGDIPRGKTIWYYGKKKLTMNEDDNKTAYYSLTLNRNHNKQIYTCTAEHDMLKTPLNQTITLDILYYPRVQSMWPKGPVSIGQNVNLSCSYYSNPSNAEISWTKNGQNIGYSHSIVTKHVMNSERNLTEIDLITEDDQDICREKEITEDMYKIPAILIYMVVCCFGVIIFVSSAQLYTCWKSGKLRKIFSKTRTFQTVTSGETVHLDSFNTVENVSEINTAHYMEIEF